MDGRGRAFDNIFTERLWRSVKYEEVYLKDYQVCREAREGLEKYFIFYNYTKHSFYRIIFAVIGRIIRQLNTYSPPCTKLY